MENLILLLVILLVVLVVALIAFFVLKKEKGTGVYTLSKSLPHTLDAPLKLTVKMYDDKNNKAKININETDYDFVLQDVKNLNGVVLNASDFNKMGVSNNLFILVSKNRNEIFFNREGDVFSSGYYFLKDENKVVNLSGEFKKIDDDTDSSISGLIIDMKNVPITDVKEGIPPATFSYKAKDEKGEIIKTIGGEDINITGAIGSYAFAPITKNNPVLIVLNAAGVPNPETYTWTAMSDIRDTKLDPKLESLVLFLVTGDLNRIAAVRINKDENVKPVYEGSYQRQ